MSARAHPCLVAATPGRLPPQRDPIRLGDPLVGSEGRCAALRGGLGWAGARGVISTLTTRRAQTQVDTYTAPRPLAPSILPIGLPSRRLFVCTRPLSQPGAVKSLFPPLLGWAGHLVPQGQTPVPCAPPRCSHTPIGSCYEGLCAWLRLLCSCTLPHDAVEGPTPGATQNGLPPPSLRALPRQQPPPTTPTSRLDTPAAIPPRAVVSEAFCTRMKLRGSSFLRQIA